ncbi:radical SAM protein [Chitinimonas sp.]|uniref:radical SAM protein n=1 Tax=Chitinimonas sp. TaxID=1934313 RepID=UPI0035AF6957
MADSSKPTIPLHVNDHRRDILGFRYIYPVVSRRAGGVSVGINLNPNNACNWRCIYCQVPDLRRGGPPDIDLALLREELAAMLDELVNGDFMVRNVPESARRLNDIALSGNGEPTASKQFAEVIDLIAEETTRFGLTDLKLVLISNGSQMYRSEIQTALTTMSRLNGEVWFKFDQAPIDGYSDINQIALSEAQILRHLNFASTHCPTWIQTCMFCRNGEPPGDEAVSAYLAILEKALETGCRLEGVLLYGVARPSTQPEAPQISAAPLDWMEKMARKIEAIGLPVKLSA